MDETPVEQERACGAGACGKMRPRSRFEKVLFIDVLCFSVAAALLLVHFMMSPSDVLAAVAVALLALTVWCAVYEHAVISRSRGEPGERPALKASGSHVRLLSLIVLLPITVSVFVNCLATAGGAALLAWVAGWDVSRAAWLGFLSAVLWHGALLAYGLLRLALLFLHFRPRFAGAAAE